MITAKLTSACLGEATEGWNHIEHRCELVFTRKGKSDFVMRFPYRTGLGHVRLPDANVRIGGKARVPTAPKIRDVLQSLASDANCAEETFSDWCANLGYSEDSRKALTTYLEGQETAVKLRKAGFDQEEIQRMASEDFEVSKEGKVCFP